MRRLGRPKPRDRKRLVAWRCEMLLRHRVEGVPVSVVAEQFGVSRQTFYKLARAFDAEGIAGLLPRRSGPRQGYKCTREIVAFAAEMRRREKLRIPEIVERVRARFRVDLSPNTIRSALAKAGSTGQ